MERIGKLKGCLNIFIYYIKIGEDWKIEGLFRYIISKYNYLDIFWIYLFINLLLKLERIGKLEDCLDIFIYLFIILKLERIGKLESYLDIFIYYIIIGEDWKIGYIISKYNYWDIF